MLDEIINYVQSLQRQVEVIILPSKICNNVSFSTICNAQVIECDIMFSYSNMEHRYDIKSMPLRGLYGRYTLMICFFFAVFVNETSHCEPRIEPGYRSDPIRRCK